MDKNLDSLPSKELLHSESLNTSGGHLEVVELCANGADIDSQDDRKLSFLMAAFREGYVDVFKLLVNRLTQFPSDQEMDRFMTTVTDKEMIKKCSQFVDTIRIAKERQAAEANKNANIFLEMESLVWSHILIKTGLTSLMGADVDVPPVPASHTVRNVIDEKGQLIQLIYDKATIVNVKNKKGQSVLWLAATAGHLDLVKLLHENGANIDSQDNREVSCLMAAFRTGQDKVVEWMVKHVKQFPSDQEMDRIKKTVTDEVMKEKCSQCEHIIRIAKEVKAAEAEKNFTDLADLDMKKSREENQKAAGARKKEKKRQKKREKQAQLRAVKAAAEESEKSEKSDDHPPSSKLHLSDPSDDEDEKEEEVEKNDSEILPSETNQELSRITAISNRPSKSKPIQIPSLSGEKLKEPGCLEQDSISCVSVKCNSDSRSDKKKDKVKTQEKNKRNISNKTSGTESSTGNEILVAEKHSPKAPDSSAIVINTSAATTCSRMSKKRFNCKLF